MGFDHEISEEAEEEMEKEEESLLKSLGWKGKGLIQSAYNSQNNSAPTVETPDGNYIQCLSFKMHTFFLFFLGREPV